MIKVGDTLVVYNPFDEPCAEVTVSVVGCYQRVWLTGEIHDPRWHPSIHVANASQHNWYLDSMDDNVVQTVNDSLNGYYAKKKVT